MIGRSSLWRHSWLVDSRESSSAAMDSLNQMTQAAIHQPDKSMEGYVAKWPIKWYYVKGNGNRWNICKHTNQLVGREASAKDIQIRTSSQSYFQRCTSIYFVTALGKFMSMCTWPLEDACNRSLAPVVIFSTHGILWSCVNWNEAFQAYRRWFKL